MASTVQAQLLAQQALLVGGLIKSLAERNRANAQAPDAAGLAPLLIIYSKGTRPASSW